MAQSKKLLQLKSLKKIEEYNKISGVSVSESRGKWRVIIGKKITGKDVIDKSYANVEEAATYAESWVKVRAEKSESAKKLSDAETEDAYTSFKLLMKHKVKFSMLEIVRKYVDSLPSTKALTINELVESFLINRDKTKRAGARHYKQLEYSFKVLTNVFHERLAHELTIYEIEDFLDSVYEHHAPKTYNNHLTNINSLLNFGVKKNYLKKNVASGIDTKQTTDLEVGILTPTQVQSLLDIAKKDHPRVLIPLALQVFAGLRRSEVMRLTWEDLEGDDVSVSATKAKTNTRRTIPILPPLKALLENYKSMPSDQLIYGSTVRMLHEWRVKCSTKAGIEWKHNCLRHSFVTYRLIDQKDANLVALEAGHTPAILHRHYKALISNEAKVAKKFWGLYGTKKIQSIKAS